MPKYIEKPKVSDIKKWANQHKLNTMNFFNKIDIKKRTKYIVDILEKDADKKYLIDNNKLSNYLNINISNYNEQKQRKIIKEFDLPRDIHNDLERQRRVYSIYGISPTLLARSDSPKVLLKNGNKYYIRKLK